MHINKNIFLAENNGQVIGPEFMVKAFSATIIFSKTIQLLHSSSVIYFNSHCFHKIYEDWIVVPLTNYNITYT